MLLNYLVFCFPVKHWCASLADVIVYMGFVMLISS